jgi:CHAT domain-containing protein
MNAPALSDALAALVPEERRGRPGAARDAALAAARTDAKHRADWLLVAACACLATGEAREALRLLDNLGAAADPVHGRRIHAVRAWAQNLDRNFYPGGVGGELPPSSPYEVVFAQAVAAGDADTMLLEACAGIGPSMMLTYRNLVVSAARNTPAALDGFLAQFTQTLEQFMRMAMQCGAQGAACWAIAARADLQRLAGQAAPARETLAQLRAVHAEGNDPVGVANTWLLEGDWHATPGAWPETLGFALDADGAAQVPDAGDDAAALHAYANAAQALAQVDAPVATGALALRLALLAARAGDGATQAEHLATAAQAFAHAGDAAALHLVTVHRWIADLARGNLRALRVLAPLEWTPSDGPAPAIADWARTRGSVAYATGLGRLLQRCGQRWMSAGEYERAELAFRFARPLLPASGVVPDWAIPAVLAQLDDARGLPARTVARRLFILHTLPLPPPPSPIAAGVAWLQDIELCMGLVGVPGGLTGAGPLAVRVVERAVARLQADLELAGLAVAGTAPLPRDAQAVLEASKRSFGEELLAQLAGHASASSEPPESERLLHRTAARIVADVQGRAHPLAALLRARLAERAGADAEAALLFDAAIAYARSAGTESLWVAVLALAVSGRDAEARALLADADMDPAMRATLSLRARDFAGAAAIYRELDAVRPPAAHAWIDWMDRAEAAMGAGDLDGACEAAARAMDAFERTLDAVARDADRLAVADNVSAASIYLVASATRLRIAARRAAQGDAAGAGKARADAFAIAERHRALTLPPPAAAVADPRREQAATEYATAYQRLYAALALEEGDVVALAAAVGAAEHALAQVEAAAAPNAPRARPGITLADVQRALPPGACVLAYQAVGRDYIAYAVTATALEAREGRVQGTPLEGLASRLVRACAAGDASVEAATLAALLLEPFAALVRTAERVIVVPTGALNAVPFHVLPLAGQPLGVTRVVSYLPAASLLAAAAPDRPLAEGAALVVGDPAFDPAAHPGLRRLDGAAVEARAVAALYPGSALFAAAEAGEAALRSALRGRALLHVAAHGRLDDIAPNTSSIVLAGRDELTVSDLIGLRLDADLAVLSACDTGRGTTTLGGDLVGLARGLLAAGVRRCVVSLWPVDDVAACVTMVAFHARLRAGDPPAPALAAAQREVRALTATEIADRYRALGGRLGEGARAVRRQGVAPKRQLAAFPEADEADDAPPSAAQDGAKASLWAPFVLIGA